MEHNKHVKIMFIFVNEWAVVEMREKGKFQISGRIMFPLNFWRSTSVAHNFFIVFRRVSPWLSRTHNNFLSDINTSCMIWLLLCSKPQKIECVLSENLFRWSDGRKREKGKEFSRFCVWISLLIGSENGRRIGKKAGK